MLELYNKVLANDIADDKCNILHEFEGYYVHLSLYFKVVRRDTGLIYYFRTENECIDYIIENVIEKQKR